MRDPKRIEEMCRLLCVKWYKQPEQRLGQFLINYVFTIDNGDEHADSRMFHQEDNKTEQILEKL